MDHLLQLRKRKRFFQKCPDDPNTPLMGQAGRDGRHVGIAFRRVIGQGRLDSAYS